MVGRLTRVPLRKVWKDEARDFTPWLERNIDVLNEIIDFTLSSAERERPAGNFSVDIVAEDEDGNPVVIENQLERSNHDHLGKLITYVTALDAKAAIWIVADPRPEHVGAISWLNESLPSPLYLIKVEAVQIGDSEPAPLLTKIVGPSDETREVGETKKQLSERYLIRHRFWTGLLERANGRTPLHSNRSPSRHNWIGASAGKSGLSFNYVIRQHDSNVEFYIDRGKDAEAENKKIFDQLAESKPEIEAIFGEPWGWRSLEGKRACLIDKDVPAGGYRDEEEKWPEIQDAMVDAMFKLEKALKPAIAKLTF